MNPLLDFLKTQESDIIWAIENNEKKFNVPAGIKSFLTNLSSPLNHQLISNSNDFKFFSKAILRWRSYLFENYRILFDVKMPSLDTISQDDR